MLANNSPDNLWEHIQRRNFRHPVYAINGSWCVRQPGTIQMKQRPPSSDERAFVVTPAAVLAHGLARLSLVSGVPLSSGASKSTPPGGGDALQRSADLTARPQQLRAFPLLCKRLESEPLPLQPPIVLLLSRNITVRRFPLHLREFRHHVSFVYKVHMFGDRVVTARPPLACAAVAQVSASHSAGSP